MKSNLPILQLLILCIICFISSYAFQQKIHVQKNIITSKNKNNKNNYKIANNNNMMMMMKKLSCSPSSLSLRSGGNSRILSPLTQTFMRNTQNKYMQTPTKTAKRSFSFSSSLSSTQLQNKNNNEDEDDLINITTTTTTKSKSTHNTNEYLVQARIQARMEKNQVRERSRDMDRERNLRIKRLIHTNTINHTENSNDNNDKKEVFTIPNLYAVRVSVDKELRNDLKLNGREKRGRMFIEEGTAGCNTVKGLKYEIHAFFRFLKKSTYLLSAGMPEILDDGSIYSPSSEEEEEDNDITSTEKENHSYEKNDPFKDFISIENDNDVEQVFIQAQEYFESHNSNLAEDAVNRLKRPSLLLHVKKDPNAPKPPPPPTYLENIANPKDTETMTMLSFYSFPDGGIDDPEEFGLFLKKIWKPFDALGRVYVAEEGVNAQMSIPTNVLDNFKECCLQIPELGKYMENGINIDPIPLTMEEFAVVGDMDGKPVPPFRNLHIRVRQQIVADGLDKSLNWEQAGYDMPPLEWHQKLKEAKEHRESSEGSNNDDGEKKSDMPLIFDCRNDYETSVGRFEGAIPLNTTNFRDSWDVLKDQLKDAPKDVPIMTYCTGGIRCVKVGAYLTQELGFTNVSRLAGGIIAYDRTLTAEQPGAEPMFKGTNFVFDGRLGREITSDEIGECITCGAKTNLVSNCNNPNCHKRMVQCANCRKDYLGTCSHACKTVVQNSASRPSSLNVVEEKEQIQYDTVDDYSLGHSTSIPSLYEEIKQNTAMHLGSGLHMISDSAQGMLLKNLAATSREGRVLEIGSFTGYATSMFLEGAADAADVLESEDSCGSRVGGSFVMSLERDQRAFDLAAYHVGALAQYGTGEDAAKAASKLREVDTVPPSIEEDSISFQYNKAGCEIVRVTDALAYVEAMATGIENNDVKPFDIVFIDADKTRFLQYVEACLNNDKVLKRGGVMVVDNVLWKGLVLDCGADKEIDDVDKSNAAEVKKSRRARKLANTIHQFNTAIVQEDRVEVLMLPIRDGLSIIRKK